MTNENWIIPGGIRQKEQAKQITSMRLAITTGNEGRLKNAATGADPRAWKAQRDDEIAAETECPGRKADGDTRECL